MPGPLQCSPCISCTVLLPGPSSFLYCCCFNHTLTVTKSQAYLGLRSFRALRDPTSLLPLPGVMLTPFPAPSRCMCEGPPSLSLPPLLNSLPCFSPRPWEAPFLKRNRVRNSPDINSHLSLTVVQSHASYTISSSPSLCEADCHGGHPIDTRRYGGLGGPLPSQGHTAGDL